MAIKDSTTAAYGVVAEKKRQRLQPWLRAAGVPANQDGIFSYAHESLRSRYEGTGVRSQHSLDVFSLPVFVLTWPCIYIDQIE